MSSDSTCSGSGCGFSFQYGDGSGASGYYVSDKMHFDTILGGDSQYANSSASIVFGYSQTSGLHSFNEEDKRRKIYFSDSLNSMMVLRRCGTTVTGELTKTDRAVSGIFGFGQQSLSVISQLASQGITPNLFSHCLRGDGNGGGILVFGEIVEPNTVYSPLVASQYVYESRLI